MKSAIERISGVAQTFKTHFRNEMLSDQIIAGNIKKVTSEINASLPARVFNRFYQSLQFGDFLISRMIDRCSVGDGYPEIEKSVMDPFLTRTLRVPQYYGGIRQSPSRPGLLTKILNWTADLFGSGRIKDCIEDYKVLEQIQNKHIPDVLLELFSYGSLRDIAFLEAEESLKKLRSTILEANHEWTEKEIVLDDIRQIEVESVSVKNFKKTVRCAFEFSTLLRGKNDEGSTKVVERHFSGVFEFIKEDGAWKATSFTFSEF